MCNDRKSVKKTQVAFAFALSQLSDIMSQTCQKMLFWKLLLLCKLTRRTWFINEKSTCALKQHWLHLALKETLMRLWWADRKSWNTPGKIALIRCGDKQDALRRILYGSTFQLLPVFPFSSLSLHLVTSGTGGGTCSGLGSEHNTGEGQHRRTVL